MPYSISGLILCFNEEANIGRTLKNLEWLPEIVLIDSGSTDRTLEIARSFKNVRVVSHGFDSHHDQWNFGLQQCSSEIEWVLALDSDYQVSESLSKEIIARIESNSSENAYWANFDYAIEGEVIRSGIYPPVQVLFRRQFAHYLDDGHTQRIEVSGKSDWLHTKLVHDDRKSFERWVNSQLNYSRLEASKLGSTQNSELSRNDRIRKRTKWTPFIVFAYCLFIKGGILDGKNGILYAFQRMIAESFIQYRLRK